MICLEEDAFYALLDKVVHYINEKHSTTPDKWVSGVEAMKLLRITSKTTLQNCVMKAKSGFPAGKENHSL